MNNSIVNLTIVIFTAITLICIGCVDMWPQFKPTYFRKGEIIQEDTFQNMVQKENIKLVLSYYKEIWKEDSVGNIYVNYSLANDLDKLFNYTNKSLDSSWIELHLGKGQNGKNSIPK